MKDADLVKLLRAADAATPSPAAPRDLARRARAQAARPRFQFVRHATGCAAGLLLVCGWWWSDRTAPLSQPVDTAALWAEVARLRSEGDAQFAMAMRLAELRNEPKLGPEPADPLAQAQMELARAAATLVQQAGRWEDEVGATDAAVEQYQQVVSFFPDTDSARVARRRLRALGPG